MVVPLKNPLENRLTVLRALRFLNIEIVDPNKFGKLSFAVYNDFIEKTGSAPINKVNQRFSGKYPKKVFCYPPEYTARMLEVINLFINPPKPKQKRPRIVKTITNL